MGKSYDYDDKAAGQGDREPMETGQYIGRFTAAEAVETPEGSEGVAFTFEGPGQGTANFTLWTVSKEGKTDTQGRNQLNALMFLMNVKGKLTSVPGKVRQYDEAEKKFVEGEGDTFPALCDKPIGVLLQKELTTKKAGGDSFRWNLAGQFDPTSGLTASEIKEHVTKPAKVAKLLRTLKDKNSRKTAVAETAQPSAGYEGIE